MSADLEGMNLWYNTNKGCRFFNAATLLLKSLIFCIFGVLNDLCYDDYLTV